jgi:hypothetical protein
MTASPKRRVEGEVDMIRAVIPIVLLLGASNALAEPRIRVYADPECASTTLPSMEPPGPYIVYAMASLDTLAGISGAEFRIQGLPAGWHALAAPNPAAVIALGDPFGNPGANIAFATCQTARCVLLYQIVLLPATSQTEVVLEVRPNTPPSNPNFSCPLLVLCDDPYFTQVCVRSDGSGGGGGGNCGFCCGCPIEVESNTWTRVKKLYS